VEELLAASDALADAIVAARPNARQGDIFTPTVTKIIRKRIALALVGLDTDRYLDDLYEGVNFSGLRAAIHARDPHSRVPLGLPVGLLWVLPELPNEIEYRLVGRDLALWDEHAALVVDFIPNAIPEQSFARAGEHRADHFTEPENSDRTGSPNATIEIGREFFPDAAE
jgi:hypothetical protein